MTAACCSLFAARAANRSRSARISPMAAWPGLLSWGGTAGGASAEGAAGGGTAGGATAGGGTAGGATAGGGTATSRPWPLPSAAPPPSPLTPTAFSPRSTLPPPPPSPPTPTCFSRCSTSPRPPPSLDAFLLCLAAGFVAAPPLFAWSIFFRRRRRSPNTPSARATLSPPRPASSFSFSLRPRSVGSLSGRLSPVSVGDGEASAG